MSAIDSENDHEYYGSNDSDEEMEVVAVASIFEPYANEPLVPNDEGIRRQNQAVADEDKDVDGRTRQELEYRYERVKPLETWCVCFHCRPELLAGSREFRYCHEIAEAYGKVVFDELTDTHACITQHEDHVALGNMTIFKMVVTLLKDRQGKNYKKKHGQ